MQIAQVIGGYTLGAADLLRRAMGKKDKEEMAKHRDVFIAGAEKNGLSRTKATALFDLMEKFAGYGFNKSHSAAYALIAYQTAYFKAHHPAAFMAANLSLVMDDTDKVRALYDDAVANGLAILPPDVNASNYRFEPVDRARIRYGLGGIKGTGRAGDRGDRRRARGGRPVPRSLRFLPAHRQAPRQSPRGRGARKERRVRRDGAAPRDAVRVGRRRAHRGGEGGTLGRAGFAVRRFPRGGRTCARRGARVDGSRAPRAREGRTRLLPVGPSVRRVRA